jgi:hypothetical protein
VTRLVVGDPAPGRGAPLPIERVRVSCISLINQTEWSRHALASAAANAASRSVDLLRAPLERERCAAVRSYRDWNTAPERSLLDVGVDRTPQRLSAELDAGDRYEGVVDTFV